MRIDHWYTHPTNRGRANRACGAGTVIAAISAGLIAGLSQHSSSEPASNPRRVTDAALNSSVDRPAPARNAEQASPADPSAPIAAADDRPHILTSDQSPQPDPYHPAPISTASNPLAKPAPAALSSAGGWPGFHPYVSNGATGTATQITSGPHGTATVTTTPTANRTTLSTPDRAQQRADQHSPITVAPATGTHEHGPRTRPAATSDHDSSGEHGASEHSTDNHSTDDSVMDSSGDHPDTDHSGAGQVRGPGTTPATGPGSGTLVGNAYSPPAATGSGPSSVQDPATRDRVARALPPGFTPAPTPAPVSTPGSASGTQSAAVAGTDPALPATPTVPADGGVPPSGLQYQPASPGAGSGPSGALTQVACPAAVTDATCYQQVPTSGTSLAPAGGSPTLERSSAAPGPALPSSVPATPPTTGASGLAAPAQSTTGGSMTSGDCQPSGDHSDLAARAHSWSDLSQLISDRIQACLAQGMASGGSGWDTSDSSPTGSGSTPPTGTTDTKHSTGAKDSESSAGSKSSKGSKRDDD